MLNRSILSENLLRLKSYMSFEELFESEVMHYWQLPSGSSANQKKKLDGILDSANYWGTIKKDGIFMRITKHLDGTITFTSRTESKKTGTFVDKTANYPHLRDQVDMYFPNGSMLHVELHLNDNALGSSEMTKINGALPKKSIERQKTSPVYMYIFDILAFDGEVISHWGAEHRLGLIQSIGKYIESDKIQTVEIIKENLREFVSSAIANGEEGAVLCKKGEPYYVKQAPAWTYIKFKKSLLADIDLVIMGFTPPNKEYTGKSPWTWSYWENLKTGELEYGNFYKNGGYAPISQYYYEGLIGGLKLGLYLGGELKEVAVISNITDSIRETATHNPEKLLGTAVAVSAMSIDYEKKSLRHAKIIRYRADGDKNPLTCTWDTVFPQ